MATDTKKTTATTKENVELTDKKPTGTNGVAVAGFVLSLCGFFTGITFIIGLILSAVGLSQTKKTGQEGRGLALAGTIIGAIGTGLAVIGTIIFIAFFFVAIAANSNNIKSTVDYYYDNDYSDCSYEYDYNSLTKQYDYVLDCD